MVRHKLVQLIVQAYGAEDERVAAAIQPARPVPRRPGRGPDAMEPTLRTLRDLGVRSEGGRRATPGLARWLVDTAPARARGTVTIVLTGDASMRRLNREWRGIDRPPTSFRSRPTTLGPRVRGQVRHLATSSSPTGVARRQAGRAGHGYGTELKVLALHGLLHLLGYDHETDLGQMRRLEARLRA